MNNYENYLPRIITELPGPKTIELVKRKNKSFLKTQLPIKRGAATKRAFGALSEDLDGNIFLNFSSSINAVGFNHPKVVSAISDQIKKMIGGSGLNVPFVSCAEKLKSMLPGKLKEGKIGYTATGSEAIDLMTRLSRDFTKKNILVSFHGLNFGEGTSDCSRLAGVSKHMFKGGITPLISETIFAPWPYCYRCPFGYEKDECGYQCLEYFKEIFDSYDPEDITGVIFEGIPANSGVMIPPEGYLKGLRSICDENDLMLLVDEVFSGFGKTGKFLAVENWDIVPDIVALGKSMGGGLPISAVATTSDVIDNCGSIARGTVGSFSGNDVSCMAAIATMEIIQKEKLLENASKMGGYIINRINEFSDKYDLIGDIRGKGFMIGIELVKDRKTKKPANKETQEICYETYKKGLLVRSFGRYGNNNVIRITPHLITNKIQIDFALDTLDAAFKKSLKT